MLVLAIKALVVFVFLGMPPEYLQRQVQSHLVISGFCFQYHCNSLYLQAQEEKHISTVVPRCNQMQNVSQHALTLLKSTLVSANERAHTDTCTDAQAPHLEVQTEEI